MLKHLDCSFSKAPKHLFSLLVYLQNACGFTIWTWFLWIVDIQMESNGVLCVNIEYTLLPTMSMLCIEIQIYMQVLIYVDIYFFSVCEDIYISLFCSFVLNMAYWNVYIGRKVLTGRSFPYVFFASGRPRDQAKSQTRLFPWAKKVYIYIYPSWN